LESKNAAVGRRTGFEELIGNNNGRRGRNNNQNNKKSTSNNKKTNFQEAAAAASSSSSASSSDVNNPHYEESDDDNWMDDYGSNAGNVDGGGGIAPVLEERNNNITNEHDFGNEQHIDIESDLQVWHRLKEDEFHHLSSDTDTILGSSDTIHEAEILSQMQKWNTFLSSITSDMYYSLSDFRGENQQYPPSEFMTSITYDAAEKSESLLVHLLEGKRKKNDTLAPEVEVNAYGLAMEAWSHVFHARSGDRCEKILEQYGGRFGGDLNHIPSVDAYKTVLKAHLKSCSSYSNDSPSSNNSGGGSSSPGEKALGVSNLLTSVYTAGDMYLKPDVELHSQTIAAVRNTLLDWQSRRRFGRHDNNDGDHDSSSSSLEMDLAGALLGTLEQMESSLEEVRSAKEGEGIRLPLSHWHCAIRAYADALATVASIPIAEDETVAEELLAKMEQLISTNSDNIILSVNNAGVDDADTRNLLSEIQRNVEEAYTSAISARLIMSKEKGSFDGFVTALDNAVSSEEMFQGMRRRSQESLPDLNFIFPVPTPGNYRALIECWCECVRKCYSTPEANAAMANLKELPHLKAGSLLKQLEIQQAAQPIDGSNYVNVIWAWGQVLNWPSIYRQNQYYFAANAVDELLEQTMYRYANGSVYFTWNGTVTKMYNFILRLNSKILRGGEKTMKRSLKLLDQMEYWRKRSEGAIAQPDAFTFGLILKTISNSGVHSSAAYAEDILKRMVESGVKPRERHYLGVMRAYSRVGQKDVEDPEKVEAILQRVKEIYKANKSVKPTAAIYTACISAYGGSRRYNSVPKVMELFEEIKKLYEETGEKDFRPDGMLYGAVLGAISKAKSKDDSSLRQALQLLDTMETSHDEGEIESGPNRYAYTNLLHAISQSRIAGGTLLAEGLVQRMDNRSRQMNDESIRPDTHAYTTLIQIFSGSGQPDAVQRAQKWFRQMENQYEEGDSLSKPNKVTYTALINCWRRSDREDAGEEADKILTMMESKAKDGDLDLRPDAFVYASVIDTWARSNSREKAVRAWNIYQRMKQQYSNGNMESRPNNVIITSTIKACGYTRGGREDKHKALKVLLECMAELKTKKYITPTPLTYRALLNAAQALVIDDSKRRPISATIFETCCRKGQLDNTVLESLQKVQPELYVKLPESIPSKWKQNVVEERPRY